MHLRLRLKIFRMDGIESVNAGFINLARVQLGKAETLKIQLSEGLVNVDDVQEATDTFDTSGYGEPRAITVSDIRVVNAPSGVDVKVITESINNVTPVSYTHLLTPRCWRRVPARRRAAMRLHSLWWTTSAP